MPAAGVYVTTTERPSAPYAPIPSTYVVVGVTERGPVDVSSLVRSFAEFARIYGDRIVGNPLYDDVSTFFAEGGNSLVVSRAFDSAAPVAGHYATIAIPNTTAGTALTLRAADPGAAGVRTSVILNTAANTVRVQLTDANLEVVASETYSLPVGYTTPATFAALFAASTVVRLVSIGTGTIDTAPGTYTAGAPATAAPALTDAARERAMNLVNEDVKYAAFAVPGQTVTANMVTAATSRRWIVLAHLAEGETSAAAVTAATSGTLSDKDNVAVLWPWVTGRFGSATRTLPPTGYAAAVRAKASRVGPARMAAGTPFASQTLVAVNSSPTKAQLDSLSDAAVTTIVNRNGTICPWGWYSTRKSLDWRLLTYRDFLNRLHDECVRSLEPLLFEVFDGAGQLQSRASTVLAGVLGPYAAQGHLFARRDVNGNEIDPGYTVDVSSTVNPPASIAAGELRAVVGVRISPSAEIIYVTIVKGGVLTPTL
jgi:hypothetical protein